MTRGLLSGLIIALCVAPAGAQSLELKISTYQSRMRSQAPIPLEMLLSWDGAKILEGALELTFDGQELTSDGSPKPIAHYRSPDLALATGDRRFRMLLPPQQITNTQGALGIQARFVTLKDGAVIDLGSFTVVTPRTGSRRLRVGLVLPESQIAIADSQLPFAGALRLEEFRPPRAVQQDQQRGPLVTQSVRIQSRELPRTSIEYCVYDLIVLTRDGLGEVRKSSLDALTAWVRAGGRVLVDLGGRLDDTHADFVNGLLAPDSPGQPVTLGPDGRAELRESEGGDEVPLVICQFGLGRAAITTNDLSRDFDFDADSWKSMVAFLWNVAWEQHREILWGAPFWKESPIPYDPQRDFYERPTAFQPSAFSQEQELTRMLLPNRVQSIPPLHVISMLGVFLLLIAPGDYLLLGLIKRRTLTWILFPLVSLAMTFYTVRLAQETVGATDYSTSLTIVDLVDDKTIARTTRLEMLFTAAERDAVIKETEGLFTPLVDGAGTEERFYSGANYGRQAWFETQQQPQDQTFQLDVEHEPPQFEGLVPRSYTVVRQMRKWTPQLARRTWIGPPPDDLPEFDWSLIEPSKVELPGYWEELQETLTRDYPEVRLTVVRPQGRDIASRPDPQFSGPDASPLVDTIGDRPLDRLTEIEDFALGVSNAPAEHGWPHVVSRVSPTGSANLEDLWLTDYAHPHEYLVVVTMQDGDNFVALRRLYRTGGNLVPVP